MAKAPAVIDNGTADLVKDRKARATAQAVEVRIPQLSIQTLRLRLIGDSPYVCHAWSEKAKREMRQKQMKQAKQAKEAKDPHADYCDSMYWLTDKPAKPTVEDVERAKFGIPTIQFKRAAVDACTFVQDIAKTESRGAFHVIGEFVPIVGKPKMREDMVRIAMGTADIRYRGEFFPWSAEIEVRYNTGALSAEQIVNLFNVAGFSIGIGEHRPQRNGSWGMFHVAREGE